MKPIVGMLSPAGPRGRLSILILHRVHAKPDSLFPEEMDAPRFDALCGWLRNWFNVLPLDQAVHRLRNSNLPSRALAITFDDGYDDNHSVALPILKRHGLPATFFVATGFLGGGCMWNDWVIEGVRAARESHLTLDDGLPGVHSVATSVDRRRLIDRLLPALKHRGPADRLAAAQQVARAAGMLHAPTLMMRPEQVRDLHTSGMQIGAHTVNHPILAVLGIDQAQAEIVDSKCSLEKLLDAPVRLFAYPNGRPGDDYTDANVCQVQLAGFDAAVCTAWGAASRCSDLYQLPRFTPWDQDRLRFGLRMARNLAQHGVGPTRRDITTFASAE